MISLPPAAGAALIFWRLVEGPALRLAHTATGRAIQRWTPPAPAAPFAGK